MRITKWILIVLFFLASLCSFAKPAYSRVCPYPHRILPERVITAKTANKITQKITILEPKQQETIWNNQGNVSVNVQLTQALKKDERLIVFLDGRPTFWSAASFVFSLSNVDRGEHSLRAEIVNDQDTVLWRSEENTFYVHRVIAH